MPSIQPEITVLVPVHNGGAFVAEALHSIQMQTFSAFEAHISIDASRDNSLAICERFEQRDRRFQVAETGRRLGWVENINRLIHSVRTPYFCIIPQDDLIDKVYLERLHKLMSGKPEAAIAFSDLQEFGDAQRYFAECSLQGNLLERTIRCLLHHQYALPFRGLIRTSFAMEPIAPNRFPGPVSDYLWLLKLVQNGSFVQVPELLYRKRRHFQNQVYGWANSSAWSFGRGVIRYWSKLNEVVRTRDYNDCERKTLMVAKVANYLAMLERINNQRGKRRGTQLFRTCSWLWFRSVVDDLPDSGTKLGSEVSDHLIQKSILLLLAEAKIGQAWALLDSAGEKIDSRVLGKLRSSIFLAQGRFHEAWEVLQEFASGDRDPETELLFARLCRKTSRFQEAAIILQSFPEDSILREKVVAEWARLQLDQGDVIAARKTADQAYQINPLNRNILKLKHSINERL